MAASTDLLQKNINSSKPDDIRRRQETMDAIFSLLDKLRCNRPTASLAFSKTETTRRTVTKIITAAREIFTRDGHDGLTLRNVADQADIAVGNLTYHFNPNANSLKRCCVKP